MEFARNQVKVWDLPLRLFHWSLLIAIALAFLSSEEDSFLNRWHILSGWVAAVLIVFRCVWGFVGGEHSRFSNFIRPSRIADHISGLFRGRGEATLGHNPLGAVAVVILLALIAATVWTGAFGGEAAEELHEVIAWTLLAMVGVHIAAVIVMSAIERENLVRAMIGGHKPAVRHPGATDARPPTALALIVAILTIAGTVLLIVRYDPQAFTLRTAEEYEHRADAAGAVSGEGEESEYED